MYRYIAFAWNSEVAERSAFVQTLIRRLRSTLPEWKCALSRNGLQVYHTSKYHGCSQVYHLAGDSGVILGKLFERRTGADFTPHEVLFGERETHKVEESGGRSLVEHYWGRYVAFLSEEGTARIRILRDPTGAMPCFWTTSSGVFVVCSDVDDLSSLGLIRGTINWDHIGAFLLRRRFVAAETGLDGVQQIHAGECITVGSGGTTGTFYWTPDRVHRARVLEDRQQAMGELRSVVQHCVQAWASCYDSILHSLSGGLDSAVVLACLGGRSGGTRIVAQNMYTQDVHGDERVFARKAAERAGVELVETPIRPSARPIADMLDSKNCATPVFTRILSESDLVREKLVRERGIGAVFFGQGGDHFFQQIRSPSIAADYAWHHGLRMGMFNVIADTARLTGQPVWSIMTTVLKSGVFNRHADPYFERKGARSLVNDTVNPGSVRHPWLVSPKRLPGSKLLQVFCIIDTQLFYSERIRHAEITHPLISQPIIELCLQIPSYVLVYGGVDRALVRDAFADVLPPEIRRRTQKGATTSAVNELLVGNLPFLRELLLDGALAQQGLLDKKKVEAILQESALTRNLYLIAPTLSAICAESWLNTWLNDGRRAAA